MKKFNNKKNYKPNNSLHIAILWNHLENKYVQDTQKDKQPTYYQRTKMVYNERNWQILKGRNLKFWK